MINAMSVDLEDWYHSIDSISPKDWFKYESRIESSTYSILEMLNRYKIKATFFVLGHVAEKHYKLVRDVSLEGHEIASHGYNHRLVYRLTPDEFRKDLKESAAVIEGITEQKVIGFRAPYWTITKESYWALDILLEEGYQYDSSIYPIKTPLYGIPGSRVYPYVIKQNGENKLIEFPPSTAQFAGIRIPVGGGFYMRALPTWVMKKGFRKINKEGQPSIIYIHPPEFDSNKPVVKLPPAEKILHYYKLGVIPEKLHKLFSEFEFSTIREVLKLTVYNSDKPIKILSEGLQ